MAADLDFTAALDLGAADKNLQQFAGHVASTGAAMESSGQQGGGLLGALGSIGSLATGVGVVATGVGFLGGKLMEAAKAAGDDKASMDRLTGTLANNASDWKGNTDALDSYISKGQALAFTDDDVRDSLGLLVASTGNLTDAQNEQSVAMDLARSKNISLEAASKLVMKADQGSEAALKKLGIVIDKNATSEEALAAIHKATAGAADTFAASTAGSMARLDSSMGDAVESIGGAILPQLTTALGGVADFVSGPGFQGALQTGVSMLTDGIGGAISFVSGIITPFLPTLQSLGQTFVDWITGTAPLPGVLSGLTSPLTIIQTIFSTLAGVIGPVVAGFGADGLSGAVAALVTQFPALAGPITTVQGIISTLAGVIGPVVAGLGTGGLGGAVAALVTQFPVLAGPMTAVQTALTAIQGVVSSVVAGFGAGGLGGAVGALVTAFPALSGPITAVQTALTAIQGVVTSVVAGFSTGGLGGAVAALVTAFPMLQGPITTLQGVLVTAQDAGLQVATAFGTGGLSGVLDLLTGKITTANPLLTALQGVIGAVSTVVQAGSVVWSVITGQLQTLGDSVGPNLTAMWTAMQPGIAAIQPIVEALTPVFEAIGAVIGVALVASISGLMGILQGLSGMLPGLGQAFSGTMEFINGVLGVFGALFTGITDTVKALIAGDWQGALTALQTMFTNLSTAGQQIVQGMMDQIGGLFSAAFGFIEGYANGFVDTFTGLIQGLADAIGGTAKGVGDGIIGGIMSGLSKGKDAVIDFIKGIASGAVQAIKDFFGIHSPSTVMDTLWGMGGVMGGAVQGVLGGEQPLLGALGTTMGAVASAAASHAQDLQSQLGGLLDGIFKGGASSSTAFAQLNSILAGTGPPPILGGGSAVAGGGSGSGDVAIYLEGRLVDPAYLSAELRTRQRGRGV